MSHSLGGLPRRRQCRPLRSASNCDDVLQRPHMCRSTYHGAPARVYLLRNVECAPGFDCTVLSGHTAPFAALCGSMLVHVGGWSGSDRVRSWFGVSASARERVSGAERRTAPHALSAKPPAPLRVCRVRGAAQKLTADQYFDLSLSGYRRYTVIEYCIQYGVSIVYTLILNLL